MKTMRAVAACILVSISFVCLKAQWQGTNPERLLAGTNGAIVGTAGLDGSLTVHGGQVPVNDLLGLGLCTFRTDVPQITTQCWRMMRDVNDIGVLWNEGTPAPHHVAFHVQSGMPRDDAQDRYSGLFLQNHVGDGIWVMNDGAPTGGRAFPNALQLLDAKGFAALGHLNDATAPGAGNPRGPWSRLHFFHDNNGTTPWFAHRPQMRNGITFTGNSDHAYMGQWYDQGTNGIGAEVDDHTNLVIAVSENTLPAGNTHQWDNISLRFFGDLDQTDGPASTVEGLEMMRLQPYRPGASDPVQGLVGVGDFLTPSIGPTERFDVLDGRVRIRQLPDDPETTDKFKVVVVDNSGDPNERGVLKWKNVPAFACDWIVQPSYDVSTAYTGLTNPCPENSNNVGIGVQDPFAKLDVLKEVSEGLGLDIGIRSVVRIDQGVKHAIQGITTGAGSENVGVLLNSDNAGRNWGVVSFTGSGGTNTGVVSGFFQADREGDSGNAVAVWGRVANMSAVGTPWAAYFEGMGFLSNGPWVFSDEELKSDIQEVPAEASLERIMALAPKSYVFNIAEHPGMGMPEGLQYGLLAQEVEQVYPQLVKQVERPEVIGPDGQVQEEAVSFKAMKYEGLMADLIGAVQELKAQNDQLQAQINSCCSNDGGTMPPHGGDKTSTTGSKDIKDERLLISPNPFSMGTTISYYLSADGRARLEVSDASGRPMKVLREEETNSGEHTYEWNTTSLAAGTYFVAFSVNGQVVVKRAVKVNER